MNKKFAKTCLAGHIQSTNVSPEKLYGPDFCPDCGEKTITTCPNCEDGAVIAESTEVYEQPHEDSYIKQRKTKYRLQNFCGNCGEALPWTGTIKEKQTRDENFLDLDNVNGYFFKSLINEINLCYQVGADEAALILFRKLLENLVIDILRGYYGPDRIELYYNTNTGQNPGFLELIDNLQSCADDLNQFSTIVDGPLVSQLHEFKHHGDSSAHSIEIISSENPITDRSSDATNTARALFDLREKIFVSV